MVVRADVSALETILSNGHYPVLELVEEIDLSDHTIDDESPYFLRTNGELLAAVVGEGGGIILIDKEHNVTMPINRTDAEDDPVGEYDIGESAIYLFEQHSDVIEAYDFAGNRKASETVNEGCIEEIKAEYDMVHILAEQNRKKSLVTYRFDENHFRWIRSLEVGGQFDVEEGRVWVVDKDNKNRINRYSWQSSTPEHTIDIVLKGSKIASTRLSLSQVIVINGVVYFTQDLTDGFYRSTGTDYNVIDSEREPNYAFGHEGNVHFGNTNGHRIYMPKNDLLLVQNNGIVFSDAVSFNDRVYGLNGSSLQVFRVNNKRLS